MLYINSQINTHQDILKTSYNFVNNCYINLDENECNFMVKIEPKKGNLLSIEELEKEFQNELIIQQTRCIISKESKNIRELIMARAFYSAYLEEPEIITQIDNISYKIDDIAKDVFENEK